MASLDVASTLGLQQSTTATDPPDAPEQGKVDPENYAVIAIAIIVPVVFIVAFVLGQWIIYKRRATSSTFN